MQRKKKPNGLLISGLISALASLAIVAVAPGFAHHAEDHAQGDGRPAASPTPGNNGSDHDGDADSDPDTTETEDTDDNDNNTPNNVPDEGDNQHPSGNDKSVENGNSGNQGNSESDPDDDGRGPERCEPESARTSGDGTCGPDKPNGTGGTDKADQDGNNGCGNDDDFDDDNEGLCGRNTKRGGNKPEDKKPVGEDVQGTVTTLQPGKNKPNEIMPELDTNPASPTEGVLGIRISKAPAVAAAAQPAVAGPAVEAAGAVLPFTGGQAVSFLIAAFALILAGAAFLMFRRSEA